MCWLCNTLAQAPAEFNNGEWNTFMLTARNKLAFGMPNELYDAITHLRLGGGWGGGGGGDGDFVDVAAQLNRMTHAGHTRSSGHLLRIGEEDKSNGTATEWSTWHRPRTRVHNMTNT